MNTLKKIIETKLTAAFNPLFLDIKDLSHLHKGHDVGPAPQETHFKIIMVSDSFSGKMRLERHQIVHKALSDEIHRLHAIEFVLKSPEESDNTR